MPKPTKNFIQRAKEDPVTVLLQIVGAVVVLANLWLASKLSPLAKDIDTLVSRVNAIERRNDKVDPLVDEFIEQRGTFKAMKEDLNEIKQDVKDVKNYLNVR